MRKAAVFFGGKSCENEISILTGVFVMNILTGTKFTPVPIYLHTDGGAYTSKDMQSLETFKKKDITRFQRVVLDGGVLYAVYPNKRKMKRLVKIDVAINCCHGGLGEGGGVSALCALNGIPLASPDLTSSGVFMDKCMTKTVLKALNIPTVDYIRVNESDYKKRGTFLLKSIERRLKYPVIVKPAHLGSSIGISVARNETEVKTAIENAFVLDGRVLVEKYLPNKRDINCGAFTKGGEIFVSEAEEAFGDGVYSFEEKYIKRTSDGVGGKQGAKIKRKCLDGDLREKIRSYTRTVYKRMNLKGVVRMDFLVSEGKAYLCEVNTVPGSLAYYLFCERVSDARAFFTALLDEALTGEDGAEKALITTGILNGATMRK